MGLAISAQLVHLMGGHIWLESDEGKGSTFAFEIPLQSVPPTATGSLRETSHLRGIPVLIVDDHPAVRGILTELFLSWEMKPTAVEGGSAALSELWKAVALKTPFGLKVVDAQMPVMDGFVLAEQMQTEPRLAGSIVMMLSAGARPADFERCEKLGVSACLSEPLKESEVLQAFTKTVKNLGNGLRAGLPASPAALPGRRGSRILLAEDNGINQRLVYEILTKYGNQVVAAEDGKAAVEAWEKGQFDVVLMDVNMPEMDGFEATAAIRAREHELQKPRTPIIAMTALAMKGDRERCLASGMDFYLAKPIRTEQLISTIQTLAPPPLASAIESLSLSTPFTLPDGTLPLTGFLGFLGGDRKLLKTLAQSFLDHYPLLIQRLQQAIQSKDAHEIELVAHRLGGSLCYFDPVNASGLASRLEEMGRQGMLDQAERCFGQLQQSTQRLVEAFEEFLANEEVPQNAAPEPVQERA